MDRVDTDVDYNMEGNSANFYNPNFSPFQNKQFASMLPFESKSPGLRWCA